MFGRRTENARGGARRVDVSLFLSFSLDDGGDGGGGGGVDGGGGGGDDDDDDAGDVGT